MPHPAIDDGRVAVITGAADGIGFAAARRLSGLGMTVVMADNAAENLAASAASLGANALAYPLDVADRAAVETFATHIRSTVGPVSLLMNNAGRGGGGDALSGPAGWDKVLAVNLIGVLNGVQAFVPAMIDAGAPGVVINTGSKQGITQPPGDTAYNVSKAGVKALTEGLAHTLRQKAGGRITAHLLIPGFTYTGMTARHLPQKPAAAWEPDQVIDVMLAGVERGDFYLWGLDNETSKATDAKRILWGAGDIIENRPALSRWHPDYKDEFAAFVADAEM